MALRWVTIYCSPDQLTTRVEFIGREAYSHAVCDTSCGSNMPADGGALEASTRMADAEPRFAFDIDKDFPVMPYVRPKQK